MKARIEGLLIHKIPYQDRHLIGHLLLRSGRLASVLFYGGQGGGKKKKSSLLELGYMFNIELAQSRSTVELYKAKEWQPIWIHKSIRHNHQAFYLMCSYLEVTRRISPLENLHDDNLQANCFSKGLFSVLSNAIFHLENRSQFDSRSELLIFFGKLLVEQGLFPERENCGLCGEALSSFFELYLSSQHGAFICPNCYLNEEGSVSVDGEQGRELWELLGVIANHKYQDLDALKLERFGAVNALFHYLCFQLHFHYSDFKSVPMVI